MTYDFVKRLLDIIGAMIGSILFLPIFILLPIVIAFDSGLPIFYCPTRVGKNGKLFKMIKFRSMRMYSVHGKQQHADMALRRDPELLASYKKNSYKLPEDPRITTVGRMIRKTSLDEFPQFWNVFKGEMSLVGPRAYLPNELLEQQEAFPHTKPLVRIMLTGKPGLTGPWQVSGRSNINFDKRIELDVAYLQRQSLLYDGWMLLKTFPALLTGRGAV